jgi:hypothetical protein
MGDFYSEKIFWYEFEDGFHYLTILLPNMTQEDKFMKIRMYGQRDTHIVFTKVPEKELVLPKQKIILLRINRTDEPKIFFCRGNYTDNSTKYIYMGNVAKFKQFLRRWTKEELETDFRYTSYSTLCRADRFICLPGDTINLVCYVRNHYIIDLEKKYYKQHFWYDLRDSAQYFKVLDSLINSHKYMLRKKMKEPTKLELKKEPWLRILDFGGGIHEELEDKYIIEYFWSSEKLIDSLSLEFIVSQTHRLQEQIIELGEIHIPIFIVPSLEYVIETDWYDWEIEEKPKKLRTKEAARERTFSYIMLILAIMVYGCALLCVRKRIKKCKKE